MEGGATLVKNISEGNYRLLEEGLRELADLAAHLSHDFPESRLASTVAEKAAGLVEKFFTEAVPILDCSVVSVMVDEAIKQTQTLATELNSQKEWLLNASVVAGNQYLNTLKIELPEFDRLDPLDLFGSRTATGAGIPSEDYVRPQPEAELDLDGSHAAAPTQDPGDDEGEQHLRQKRVTSMSSLEAKRKASMPSKVSASVIIPHTVEEVVEMTSSGRTNPEQEGRGSPTLVEMVAPVSEESVQSNINVNPNMASSTSQSLSLSATASQSALAPITQDLVADLAALQAEEIQKLQKQQEEDRRPVTLRRLSVALSSAIIPPQPDSPPPSTSSLPVPLPSLVVTTSSGVKKSPSYSDKGVLIEWGFGGDNNPRSSARFLNRKYSYLMYKEEDDVSQGQKLMSSSTPHSLHSQSGQLVQEKTHKKSKSLSLTWPRRQAPALAMMSSSTPASPAHPPSPPSPSHSAPPLTSRSVDLNLVTQFKSQMTSTLLMFEKEKTRIMLLKRSMYRLRELNENKVALFHALHKATAAGVAALLFLIPFFANYSAFPPWAAITAYCTATTYAGTSLKRCATEALSTMTGSFLAFGFVYLVIFTGPECNACLYKPYIIFAALWLTIFFFSYLTYKKPQWELSVEVAIISFIVILSTEYLNPSESVNVAYVLDRTSMIVAGVIIAFLCSYLIFPVKGSQLIKKGLKNTVATDFGTVLSGVLELYSTPRELSKEEFSDKKRQTYSLTSSILTKLSKMKALIATTKGEVTSVSFCLGRSRIEHRRWYHCYQALAKFETFPSKRYTSILFCSNQLVYITITLFYGLQGEGAHTNYCKLFRTQLDAIRLRFEKMFVDISVMLDRAIVFLDVAAHIQVVQTLLEQMQSQHKENLVQGVTFNYTFDDIQAFSHLWSCLRLYLRKVSHLVDSVMSLHDGNHEVHFPSPAQDQVDDGQGGAAGEQGQGQGQGQDYEPKPEPRRPSVKRPSVHGYSQLADNED